MKKLFKSLLSQQKINNYYHLPKAVLANILYGFPAKKMKIIGVSGTDGKTTTTNMIYQILKTAGKRVSMISTVNAVIAGKSYDTGFHVTSPDPFIIQKFAREAKNKGDEYLVLEVTSHSLDQYRFWGIKFDIGVITNITHEHLDYHKTFENYLETKMELLKKVKFAIVNQNLKEKVKQKTKGKVITFGLHKGDFNQKDIKLKLKTIGDYNIENSLAALSVAFILGINRDIAQKTLEKFTGVKGRMEEVKNKRGITIIIDFAHTPNGLSQALKALRAETKGRLIAVFGSAGKRDINKRSLMGKIGKQEASIIVIAPEDPRGDLEKINQQIISGAKEVGGKEDINLFVFNERQEAISFAINKLARRGDTIGIFGKGHEISMNLDGKKEIPWSDFEAVRIALDG